jgi:hypothetical protein
MTTPRSARRAPASVAVAVAVGVGCVLASCGQPALTQLIVVVDSDIPVPAQLDAIRVVVTSTDGATMATRDQVLASATELPATLGVVHRDGPLEPITVVAIGRHGESDVVERRAVTGFRRGETIVLAVHLEDRCIGALCPAGETCIGGGCASDAIPASSLPGFDGAFPRLGDGGALPDGCPGRTETCNGADDDCDGMTDETTPLATDPANCGACGRTCPDYPQARGACVAGECALACTEGFGDCDGEIRTGCEQPLNTLTTCGQCGAECSVDHGAPSCFTRECGIDICVPGFGDCNDDVTDGCEAPLVSASDCGECGAPCAPANATPSCHSGICRVGACTDGYANCDGLVENGCERALGTTMNCAGCGHACPTVANGTAACAASECVIGSCTAGLADCNGTLLDGCETALDTLGDCGGCGVACALEHATEACTATGCAIAACDAGWADCDGLAATGCETSLETADDCGDCGIECRGATPVCSATTGGTRSCRADCRTGLTACGTSCVETATSLDHCGGCDRPCAPPNAIPGCSAGTCRIVACVPGFGDCNGLVSDGCERRLDTLSDCGGCGDRCELAGATESCEGGRCAIVGCATGLGDCDGSASNGCEASTRTLSSCGGCGVACALEHASESCTTGVCQIVACETGFADCDLRHDDGCETSLRTLTDCASCGTACDLPRATESCSTGTCRVAVCDAEFADCDGAPANGCETSLRTLATCGSCTTACADVTRATESCATGSCAIGSCDFGYGNCDGRYSNGCETAVTTLTNCGGCGVTCTSGNDSMPSCSTGTCRAVCTRSDRADCDLDPATGCETRIESDERNCGVCGRVCRSSEFCDDGVCRRD